jgi:FeS assembly protein IscX
MTLNTEFNRLYWDSYYEIVLNLMQAYPDVDFDRVGLAELHGWIITLPGFDDDPNMATDNILDEILCQWYEEANAE